MSLRIMPANQLMIVFNKTENRQSGQVLALFMMGILGSSLRRNTDFSCFVRSPSLELSIPFRERHPAET